MVVALWRQLRRIAGNVRDGRQAVLARFGGECCEQPFSQTKKCPKGNSPESQAAINRGEKKLTGVVHGLEADDKAKVIEEAPVE